MTTEHEANQAAFNAAWRGLQWQGWEQSIDPDPDEGLCAFNGGSGRHCAIGWVAKISEEFPVGRGITDARRHVAVTVGAWPSADFMYDMQRAHDDNDSPVDMEQAFRKLASEWNLTIPTPWKQG